MGSEIHTKTSESAIFILIFTCNPFKPNVIAQSHQLDQSNSALRVFGGIFQFYSNFNRTLCKQTVDTLIRRRRIIWVNILGVKVMRSSNRSAGVCYSTECGTDLDCFGLVDSPFSERFKLSETTSISTEAYM